MQSPPGQNAHLERRELPEENPRPVGRSMLEHYNSRTPFPWLNLQPPAVWAGQSSPSNTAWAIICLTRWTRTHRPTVCVHWHKTPGLSSIASGAISFQDKPTRQHRTQKGQAHTQEEAFSTTQLEVEWLHMLLIHGGVSRSAGNPSIWNQGLRRYLGLCTVVEGASPEQKDATAVITMSPAWGRGSCNCAKCFLFINLHWSCVLEWTSHKNFRATSSLSSARCNCLSPPGEYI